MVQTKCQKEQICKLLEAVETVERDAAMVDERQEETSIHLLDKKIMDSEEVNTEEKNEESKANLQDQQSLSI